MSAVFDAYLATFKDQIQDLRRLATGGTGVFVDGELSPDLVRRISGEAIKNADRVLGMVVRAFDYMPPVDVSFGDVVRAVVTADRELYPDDALLLRAHLVEAFRQRGIFPPGVVSLADQALLWRRPVRAALSLTEPGTPVDLSPLILDSTLRLDPAASTTAPLGDGSQERATKRSYAQVHAWAVAHAYELGLDPDAGAVKVEGIHVAYQTAADGQARPRIIAQIVQRRHDLETGDDPESRARLHAGCTIVANIDGTVSYVIPKSLPYRDAARLADIPDAAVRAFASDQHRTGIDRLNRLRKWSDDIADNDALAAWLTEPSLSRLTFARLHSAEAGDE